MPLHIQSLERSVTDDLLAAPTLGQDSVGIAVVTIGPSVLLPVGHACSELDQATIALEVFRVPAEVHSTHTSLQKVGV